MSLYEHAAKLQEMASGPGILDAVDTYYADDVTIVEATGDTFHGKETQKQRIIEWQKNVEAVHGGGIKALAVHETGEGTGVAFVESYMDLTFKQGGRMPFEEVAVQQWKDGQVVHERFYYNAP